MDQGCTRIARSCPWDGEMRRLRSDCVIALQSEGNCCMSWNWAVLWICMDWPTDCVAALWVGFNSDPIRAQPFLIASGWHKIQNRHAICLNCNRIANILICNWVDCKRRDHRLHQDCDNPGERVFWIVGPREDCKGPQASVWTCPRVRAQT